MKDMYCLRVADADALAAATTAAEEAAAEEEEDDEDEDEVGTAAGSIE